MENYFNYFTEIEERFQRRRGSLLLLSTLDWTLIEIWRDAGVPLEAVLRGIDAAFDKYESRKSHTRVRRVNGLAYCVQAVMQAVEDMKEASVGTATTHRGNEPAEGFEQERIATHLEICGQQLQDAKLSGLPQQTALELSERLKQLAQEVRITLPPLEEFERNLTTLEEKLFATLLATMPESDLLALKEQAAKELAPYRSRMQAVQIRQVEQQFLHKRLLEDLRLPRLSLFYMSQT